MKEEGRVIEIEGNIAKVQIERKALCDSCRACNMSSGDVMIADAENVASAKVGEKVEVEIDSPRYLKVVFTVYIFPLIGLIVGYIIGESITNSELAGIFSGIGGLFLCFGLIYSYDKRLRRSGKLKSKISRVISA